MNRWLTRLSSPVARVLVVFFLSLCALCFLGSYVVSAKIVRTQIMNMGGDLVTVTLLNSDEHASALPGAGEIKELFGADSYCLRLCGSAFIEEPRKSFQVATYDFCRVGQMFPLMAESGCPTLLLPEGSEVPMGPLTVSMQRMSVDVFVRHLPADNMLFRLFRHGIIVVQPETLAQLGGGRISSNFSFLVLRVPDLKGPEDLKRVEQYFRRLGKLDGVQMNTSSVADLLREMDNVLDRQVQCRAAFCLGIGCIVGILLTALSGMEYRQNEYIYTLMKSFGIHPLLLVLAFLVENTLLVAFSFLAAVAVFMQSQHYIISQFFKLGRYTLSLNEIMPEIRLIAAALAVCVLISSFPIILATNREIGRVLK
ncbi:MAG: hypothetical protein MSQ05_06805 [Akkermansia sp.]|nr:hypothetical protein [Akkermansia sp.]